MTRIRILLLMALAIVLTPSVYAQGQFNGGGGGGGGTGTGFPSGTIPTSAAMLGTNSSGAPIVPSGALMISAVANGVKADAKFVRDATWTNLGTSVSCPNSDCGFTAADTGKTCYGIDPLTGNNYLPTGTFTFVSAQAGTCSVAATATITAAGNFVWGTDDTAAWLTTWAASLATPNFSCILAPSGNSITTKAQFVTAAATWKQEPCMWTPGQLVMFPTPSFDPTTCNGPDNACFWDINQTGVSQDNLPQYSILSNFGINGMQFACTSGYNNLTAFNMRRVNGINYWIWDWCLGNSGFIGINVVSPNSVANVDVNNVGVLGFNVTGSGSNAMTWLPTSYCGQTIRQCVVVNSGAILVSKGSFWLGCTTQCYVVNAGGIAYSDGDQYYGSSGNQYIDIFGTAFFNNVNITATNNNGAAILTRATGLVYITNSFVAETGTSGKALDTLTVPGGTIYIEDGNSFTGTTCVSAPCSIFQDQINKTTTQTTTYNAAASDFTILCNGTFTTTLPITGIFSGKVYNVKNIGSGTCTVSAGGSVSIDAATTYTLPTKYSSVTVTWDGSQYWIQ